MKLSKRNWLVWAAYFLDDDVPLRTDLCTLFWRLCLFPVKGAFCVVLGAILLPFCGVIWLFTESKLALRIGSKVETAARPISQRVTDWKSKTCTIVEID